MRPCSQRTSLLARSSCSSATPRRPSTRSRRSESEGACLGVGRRSRRPPVTTRSAAVALEFFSNWERQMSRQSRRSVEFARRRRPPPASVLGGAPRSTSTRRPKSLTKTPCSARPTSGWHSSVSKRARRSISRSPNASAQEAAAHPRPGDRARGRLVAAGSARWHPVLAGVDR